MKKIGSTLLFILSCKLTHNRRYKPLLKVYTLSICLTLLIAETAFAQSEEKLWPKGTEPAVIGKRVAENYVKRKHGKNLWYGESITWHGAFRVAEELGDQELAGKLVRRFDFYLKPENKARFRDKFHVDFAVLGVIPIEVYLRNGDEHCRELGMARADEQWEEPDGNGITRQARYWVDDMYMITAIQTAAYRVTSDLKYIERTALTIADYLEKLQKPDGLFWHAEDSPFAWGRGNGWYAVAMADILKVLPSDNSHYQSILVAYKKMMETLLSYQCASGLWRQVIDDPEFWEETSGSAMFAYAMIVGVKHGWLDAKTYEPATRKAWLALVDQLDAEGNLKNVCMATSKAFNKVGEDAAKQRAFYMERPAITGNYHGQGPMLWIAAELLEEVERKPTALESGKAYARFVPERLDDFAWENDRVAFRMYGPALWEIPEKRSGSGIDVWVKKVRYPVIDAWYKRENYHKDYGEGADYYSVGKTLGCGGLGFWVDGKLRINNHFESYKVIKGSGNRIEFELTYAPLAVGGQTVTVTKRISMEQGSNLFTVKSAFKVSGVDAVTAAVGITLRKGKKDLLHGENWVSYAEPHSKKSGQTYCGVVLEDSAEFKEADDHALMLVPVKDGDTLHYQAGAAWNRGIDFRTAAEWHQYIKDRAFEKTQYSSQNLLLKENRR